jgi:hypothetical protein
MMERAVWCVCVWGGCAARGKGHLRAKGKYIYIVDESGAVYLAASRKRKAASY